MSGSWMKRRWYEFRNGHSIYLVFLLSFTNFFLITYNFLIGNVPLLSSIFPSLGIFVSVAILVYVPLAILVGHWHNRKQLSVDTEIVARANPVTQELLDSLGRIEKKLQEISDNQLSEAE